MNWPSWLPSISCSMSNDQSIRTTYPPRRPAAELGILQLFTATSWSLTTNLDLYDVHESNDLAKLCSQQERYLSNL